MSSQPNTLGGSPLILATDAQGLITGSNDAFRRQLGCSARALASRPLLGLLHAVQPPVAAADLGAGLLAGEPWAGLLAYRQNDGAPCWLQAQAVPLRRHGEVAGFLVFHAPLTATPLAEPQLDHARRPTLTLAWRLRLGAAALAALPAVSGLVGGLAGAALLAHLGLCALVAAVLPRWWQAQLLQAWHQVQRPAQALAAGRPVMPVPAGEDGPLVNAMHQASLQLQALIEELGPQVEGVRSASQALALQADDLGQRTELAAAALQETATTVDHLHAELLQPAEPAQVLAAQALGLSMVCEAMERLDETTQRNAARTDACKTAAAALAQKAERLSASLRLFRPDLPG